MASLREVIREVLSDEGVIAPDGLVDTWKKNEEPGYFGGVKIQRKPDTELVDALATAVGGHLKEVVEKAVQRYESQ